MTGEQLGNRIAVLRARLRTPAVGATVPGSLPVLFFGDILTARVATVGLNPSDQEYLAADGAMLHGDRQRLATLASLGAGSRLHLTDAQCDSAIETMRKYHAPGKPVYGWFRPLTRVLAGLGAGYADGSAVHLDLVQEATRPTWSGLDGEEKEVLRARDAEFLAWQIREFPIDIVLCTSRLVSDLVRDMWGVVPLAGGKLKRLTWWAGRARVDDRVVSFAGWNLPLSRPTGLGADGEVELGRLLASRLGVTGARSRVGDAVRVDPDAVAVRRLPVMSSAASDGRLMQRVTRERPISRREFELALMAWVGRAQPHDTIGDTSRRGQTPWVHVRVDGTDYYLNADSTRAGVSRYLGLLAVDPVLTWVVVANRRGRKNKVAFGPTLETIPGFYFYARE